MVDLGIRGMTCPHVISDLGRDYAMLRCGKGDVIDYSTRFEFVNNYIEIWEITLIRSG